MPAVTKLHYRLGETRPKIYLASSWRNKFYPKVLERIASEYTVYDFRGKEPESGSNPFNWDDIDPNWLEWTPQAFKNNLSHKLAFSGFSRDMEALKACDVLVLLLPCGRSAHLEAGYAVGAKKRVIVYLKQEGFEPELMYKMIPKGSRDIVFNDDELMQRLRAE